MKTFECYCFSFNVGVKMFKKVRHPIQFFVVDSKRKTLTMNINKLIATSNLTQPLRTSSKMIESDWTSTKHFLHLDTDIVTFRPLVKQTKTRNLYITIYIYFLDGRLCEVGAVRRGIRIVRRSGLNFSMSGDNGRVNAHSVTTREVL